MKNSSEQERCKHRERVRCVNLGERVMQTKPIQQRTSLKKSKMSPRLAARDTARRRSRTQPGLTTEAQAARDTALHFGRSRAQPGGALTRPDSSRSESDTVRASLICAANTARFKPKRVWHRASQLSLRIQKRPETQPFVGRSSAQPGFMIRTQNC